MSGRRSSQPALLAAGAGKNAADQDLLMSVLKTADGTSLVIKDQSSRSVDQHKGG